MSSSTKSSNSSKSSNSTKSSNSRSPTAPLPYSFRPQDFGAPERDIQGVSARLDRVESDGQDEAHPVSEPGPDAVSAESAGRANILAARASDDVSYKVPRKEEHTILMAVPPPAQENKGT